MKLILRIFALTLAWAAVSYPTVFAATTVAVPMQRPAPPQIASVNPQQIATSTSTETITVNGSGFDSSARVELMFDVGPGAGQWRLPRHGFQVLGASQIRLTVMPGTDPDQLRIRVVSGNGTSNLANVRIVASAPKAVAILKSAAPISPPSMATAGSTPPIAPSMQPKAVAPQATPALPAPKIVTITPSSLPVSSQPQTITINGSGFERDTRVEWMYGVGTGAGQWLSPRNVPEVLSSTQIRVTMQGGNDPDKMQIRVVSKQGYSNTGNLNIVKVASDAAAATAQTRSAPTPATPIQSTLALTPPVLPPPFIGTMASTTPQTANLASKPALRIPQFNSCGPSGGGGDIKQKLLAVIRNPIDSAWAVGVAGLVRAMTQSHEVVTAVGYGYSFDPACVSHDACYGRCGPPGARDLCDQEFYRYLGAICGTLQDTKARALCEDNRLIYTGFVIQYGKGPYDKSCPTSQSASQPKAVTAPPTLSSALATNAAGTSPQTSKPDTQLAPKISAITPSSLLISTQMQTIAINGSGFDRDTRVEWMYGVGTGAGQWRSPRNTPEVLSGTQIRVTMQSGNDPDRMQIRVVNVQGYSNVGNLAIVKSVSTATGAATLNSAPSSLLGAGSPAPVSANQTASTSGNRTTAKLVSPLDGLDLAYGFYDRKYPDKNNDWKEHTGVDLRAKAGTTVYAICDGTVSTNTTGRDDIMSAFLIVKHNCPSPLGAVYGYYGHISSSFQVGASVTSGKSLGTVRTWPNNSHLHFGLNTKLLSTRWGIDPKGTTLATMTSEGWLNPMNYLK